MFWPIFSPVFMWKVRNPTDVPSATRHFGSRRPWRSTWWFTQTLVLSIANTAAQPLKEKTSWSTMSTMCTAHAAQRTKWVPSLLRKPQSYIALNLRQSSRATPLLRMSACPSLWFLSRWQQGPRLIRTFTGPPLTPPKRTALWACRLKDSSRTLATKLLQTWPS